MYFGNTEGDDKKDSRSIVNNKTTTRFWGVEFEKSYNFNNQGIHRGIILGIGFGGQQTTISDELSLFNVPIVERNIMLDTWYLFGKIGYGYLFDNNVYLGVFGKKRLILSCWKGLLERIKMNANLLNPYF